MNIIKDAVVIKEGDNLFLKFIDLSTLNHDNRKIQISEDAQQAFKDASQYNYIHNLGALHSNWEKDILVGIKLSGEYINRIEIVQDEKATFNMTEFEGSYSVKEAKEVAKKMGDMIDKSCTAILHPKKIETPVNLIVRDEGNRSLEIAPNTWVVPYPFCKEDADEDDMDFFKDRILDIYSNYGHGKLAAEYDFVKENI